MCACVGGIEREREREIAREREREREKHKTSDTENERTTKDRVGEGKVLKSTCSGLKHDGSLWT